MLTISWGEEMIKRNIKKIIFKFRYGKRITLGKGCDIEKNAKFEGENQIGKNTIFSGELGYGSYIGDNSIIYGKVKKYCCIAGNVHVINGFHPTNTIVSIYPAFYTKFHSTTGSYVKENYYDEFRYADQEEKLPVIIGNDVWIGFGALLLAGVTIGDGAIIACGAVVTKNVEPYSIVAGIPAKKIGQRFNDDQIKMLLKIKWWDNSLEWIKKNADMFLDINKFLNDYTEKTSEELISKNEKE